MLLFGSIHRAKELRQFMARRNHLRARGTVEPAQPTQGPRKSIFSSSGTHQFHTSVSTSTAGHTSLEALEERMFMDSLGIPRLLFSINSPVFNH